MKVFISWSGELSKNVAGLLSTWLEDVLQGVTGWLSKGGIEKGSFWFDEITKQLSETKVGILCVTQGNQTSRLAHFVRDYLKIVYARS